MGKISRLLVVIMLGIVLTSCSFNSTTETVNKAFDYTLSRDIEYDCDDGIEQVIILYGYEYYFTCQESQHYYIKDRVSHEYSIYEIIDEELLTIDQIFELFDGNLLQRKVYVDHTLFPSAYLINEYTLYSPYYLDSYPVMYRPNNWSTGCEEDSIEKKTIDLKEYSIDLTCNMLGGKAYLNIDGYAVPLSEYIPKYYMYKESDAEILFIIGVTITEKSE